ncbi:hypothetical protein B0H16DRAFT_1452346 [Mycena metata]|uniref:MYND-type domain-containing protein n=1 Tax=Mycena metata TaxID=1033252 RepID=A0AAD7NP98_9AGAR|nr:hypothetical protein B0H16DRAFT_1452346 [Mycena metata]
MDTGRPTVSPLWRLISSTLDSVVNEPEWPGEVKGVSNTFSLEVRILGKNQTVDISFDVETVGWYEIFEQAEIERLYRELVERIGPELTHNSEEWKCEHCGRAAIEFQWLSVYTELEKMCRRGTIITNAWDAEMFACCIECASKSHAALLLMGQRGQKALGESTVVNTIPRPDGLGPPSGACITCHKDPEAETELFIMSRCAKCKLVRYCGVACQKDDWSRHKAVCRKITKVSRGCNEKEKKVEIFSAADFFPDV